MSLSRLSTRVAFSFALIAGVAAHSAHAGISYKLSKTQAMPGETVKLTAILFNDTDTAINWTAPKTMVIQWRGPTGQATRSLAYLDEGQGALTVPVNNFVQMAWRVTVPSEVQGLQAVNVEGDSTLLALDASRPGRGLVASHPASVPVIDAGKAGRDGAPDPALPSGEVIAAGAPLHEGPAPAVATPVNNNSSAFENFRNSLQPYEPIYFAAGQHDGKFARFQISLKYRLFRPENPEQPDFIDNFYLGYTQTSLWDLSAESSPFVDTSFKPSVFWRKDALLQSRNKQWFAGLQTGVEHESNGKAGVDSRSLNFYYVQPEFNYRFDGGSTLTFAPRVKTYFGVKDNPDYADYYGHIDWKVRWAQDNGLVLTGLYRRGDEGRYASQIEAAWPLRRTFLNMNGYLYAQYTKGYGNTLLSYDQKTGSQVRVGLALIP